MSQVILSVKDLVMRFGGLLAVDQVAFDVNKNEIFSIIGPSTTYSFASLQLCIPWQQILSPQFTQRLRFISLACFLHDAKIFFFSNNGF